MIKKQALLNYLQNDLYVRVQRSDIHGVGLFAIRNIPKGVNPFHSSHVEKYIEFNTRELEHLPDEVQKMIHDYCAEYDDKVWIPEYGFNPTDILRFINHSDNHNVETIDEGTTFLTTRDIKKGEELVSNYSHYDEDFAEKF
ncbi:MAG: SET domain-containing protein [Microgenomates group bacterium]